MRRSVSARSHDSVSSARGVRGATSSTTPNRRVNAAPARARCAATRRAMSADEPT
jgi:hypothetical protein